MKIALIPATFLPIIGELKFNVIIWETKLEKNRVDVILLNKVFFKKKIIE